MEYKSKDHDKYEKILGKISSVSFGMGGYQDAMFGLSISFELKSSACGDFVSGGWAYGIIDPDSPHCKWDETDRAKSMAQMCKTVCQIIRDAKIDKISDLKGKPVEIASAGWNDVKSWRILEEVL